MTTENRGNAITTRTKAIVWLIGGMGWLLISGCGGDPVERLPPPLGYHSHTCICDCERCVERDPSTGVCIRTARNTTKPAICSNNSCGAVNPDDAEDKCADACQRTANNCTVSIDRDACVENFCADDGSSSASRSAVTSGEGPLGATLWLDPALSMMFVSVEGQEAGTSVSGQLQMRGGVCNGESCPVEIATLRLTAAEFDFEGMPIEDIEMMNNGTFESAVGPDGTALFSPNSVSFLLKATVDGHLTGMVLGPDAPATLSVAEDGSKVEIVASCTGPEGISIDLFLVARFDNRPPEAHAGFDQTVECDESAEQGTRVSLFGNASTDPDGRDDIVLWAWLEDFDLPSEQPIALGEEVTVSLGLGVHEMTLLLQDRVGAQDTAHVRVSVVDTQAPEGVSAGDFNILYRDLIKQYYKENGFGPPPALTSVALEDCLGMATIEDQCAGELPLAGHATITRVEMRVPQTTTAPSHARKLKMLARHPFFTELRCAGFEINDATEFEIPLGAPALPSLSYEVFFDVTDPSGNTREGRCTANLLSELREPGPATIGDGATCFLCIGDECPTTCPSSESVCRSLD